MTDTARLAPGDKAPAFSLPDADGKKVSLADYKGRRVIVYFYPAASTPGCTKQACDFRDNLAELNDAGIDVIGISPDKPAKLREIPRRRGSDLSAAVRPDKVLTAWGAYGEKTMYGKTVQRCHPLDLRGRREGQDRRRALQREGHRPRRQTAPRLVDLMFYAPGWAAILSVGGTIASGDDHAGRELCTQLAHVAQGA